MIKVFSFQGLELYPKAHRCFLNGQAIKLTDTEFSILKILLENKGQTVNTKDFARRIWPDETFVDCKNAISVHVHHISLQIKSQAPNEENGTPTFGYDKKATAEALT